tara:strand:- start:684 stop:821 length:138 start_codon:yes stop_codon:yes gene_type:complete
VNNKNNDGNHRNNLSQIDIEAGLRSWLTILLIFVVIILCLIKFII